MEKKYQIIGVMSGTSLDGVDLAWVEFIFSDKKIDFSIRKSRTVPYDRCWISKLQLAPGLNGFDLIALHNEYGRYLGNIINNFVSADEKQTIDYIASHGHTIFHQPGKQVTFQLGNGNSIAAKTGIATVYDFRSMDVALGGQGAPLVPIGDELLFNQYDYCLNIGGFANVSYKKNGKRLAFDICPANIVLNFYAQKLHLPYDKNGQLARQGKCHQPLLDKLNQLPYYRQSPPKSLGREWVEEVFLPVIQSYDLPAEDILHTLTEHIALQIAQVIPESGSSTLITGGGAKNSYLTERIGYYSQAGFTIPDTTLIDFKEAVIFALLGALYIEKWTNCLQSVTGAQHDNIGGALCFPGKK